jgi:transposase
MEKHEFFIGVDISKSKLDVSVLKGDSMEAVRHKVYDNTSKGIGKMLTEVLKGAEKGAGVLFCLEHTGVYGMPLATELSARSIDYAMVPASVIQRSIGLKRGKSDKADSMDIARYACLHRAEIKLTVLPEATLSELKLLLSHRERVVGSRKKFIASAKETEAFIDPSVSKAMVRESQAVIKSLDKALKQVDTLIKKLIESDSSLKATFELVTSVPGVGPQIACHLLIYTRCFTTFDNARQLACYAGIAPFEYSSGSSIKGRTRVSHLANKKLKSLFNMGALSARLADRELELYYQRKVAEGKNGMLVMNAIRNKLIGRIFATVKRGTPYVPIMRYAA